MSRMRRYPAVFVALWMNLLMGMLLVSVTAAQSYDPVAMFPTWQQDPTTTMTIDWYTTPDEAQRPVTLQYKARGSQQWQQVTGKSHPFPYSDWTIHRAEITGLQPGGEYDFRFGEDSKAYWFRTMPANNDKPIRFITGGDTGTGQAFQDMNRVAMSYNPDFILWGGDLAYANDDPSTAPRWQQWLKDVKQSLVTEDGRIVPIIAGIGNHEAGGRSAFVKYFQSAAAGNKDALKYLPNAREGMSAEEIETAVDAYLKENNIPASHAIFYYNLFAFPGEPSAYGVLDFGNYLSIVVLNSGHGPNSNMDGAQTEWLEKTLQERAGKFKSIIPIYHVASYPSVRKASGSAQQSIRQNWVPLFEKYGVQVAFENHDHAYKRTVPIKDGKENPEGIVFIGDGSWVKLRKETHSREDTWYLAYVEGRRYALVVTLDGKQQSFQAVGEDGKVFDTHSVTMTTP